MESTRCLSKPLLAGCCCSQMRPFVIPQLSEKAQFCTEKNLLSRHYQLHFLPFSSLLVMTRDPDHFLNCWAVIIPTLRSHCWQPCSGFLLQFSVEVHFPGEEIICFSSLSHTWGFVQTSQCIILVYPRLAAGQTGCLPCCQKNTESLKTRAKMVISDHGIWAYFSKWSELGLWGGDGSEGIEV